MNLQKCSSCQFARNPCPIHPLGVHGNDCLDFRLQYETDFTPTLTRGHWFRKVGEMKTLMSMSYNAKRILNNCDQDISDSKIPNFTAGTNLDVKWALTKL